MTEDPFSAPASAPSINKIPFLVFDAILVITAVALALTSGGPLSPVLFFWILLCVIVGGLVGCLPFWIEFRDKVRLSEYEIRERQSSVHDSQWQYVDARLAEQNEYLQKLHLRLSDSADRLASLEARPASPTADEVALLCGSALQKQWPAWREELLTVLSRRTDVLFNEQNAQTAKFSASHESRLSELRKEFSAVEAVLRGLETRVSEIALLSAASAATMVSGTTGLVTGGMARSGTQTLIAVDETEPEEADPMETAVAESETAAADNAFTAAESETVAADNEFTGIQSESVAVGNESGLDVADAAQTADSDSAATVSANESVADNLATETPDSTAAADATAPGDSDSVADPAATAVADAIVDAQTGEDDAIIAATAGSDNAAADVAPVAEVGTGALADDPVVPTEPSAAVPEQPALLETPAVLTPARAGKTSGAEKTTLVAQVLIGIGNKPYVRGIGPGLSLEKGVPMQFVEIGKWEWVCPSSAVPVKIQIYKNDETPSTLGQIELEPGQRKAVTPFFPK